MADRTPSGTSSNPRGYRVLALVILMSLTIPRMVQRGMFVDGVTYAALSRNLAIGVGSLWAPVYTETFYSRFFEQPPLGFALQAAAFFLLGDHLYVERGFAVCVFLLHALLIAGVWRELMPRDYDWLPTFFWVLPAVVTWAVVNNMLENTQSLLTTTAVYALLRARRAPSAGATAGWSVAAGLAVVAATLVKGPVGLFPLAVPPLMALLLDGNRHRRPVHWAAMVAGLSASVVVCGLFLFLQEAPRFALGEFVRTHLAPALSGSRGDTWSASTAARHFVFGILSRLVLAVGLVWLFRPRGNAARPPLDPATWFFLGTAAVASVPLLASRKLAGHYFLGSLPFYALAAASTALPVIMSRRTRPPRRWARAAPVAIAGGLIVAAVLILTLHGTLEPRDRRVIGSFDAIAGTLPRATTVGTCETSTPNWGLVAYAQRFFRVSLATTGRPANGWFLLPAGACTPPAGCRVAAAGATLQLFQCSD